MDAELQGGLDRAVAAVWTVFGARRLSNAPEVCLCPVCMNPATRDRLRGAPARGLPEDLVQAYSNSAHGVPNDTDDLVTLLPRYLEMIAADMDVDDIGVGTELLRFGDAHRADPALFAGARRVALDGWMRAYVAACCGSDEVASASHALQMLLAGPFEAAPVLAALDAGFDRWPDTVVDLADSLSARRPELDLFAIGYAPPVTRSAVIDWLSGAAMRARLGAIAPGVEHPRKRDAVRSLIEMSGTLVPAMIPDRRGRRGRRRRSLGMAGMRGPDRSPTNLLVDYHLWDARIGRSAGIVQQRGC